MKRIMLVCLAMALISALIYVLLGIGVMHAGDLTSDDGIPAFFYIIPGGYIIGGLLILLKKRWLWITGAVINAFTIVMFYTAYAARPDILLSAPGLITKIAQVLLEIGLIYLIVKSKPKEATVNIK
jgi:hypothetical protein